MHKPTTQTTNPWREKHLRYIALQRLEEKWTPSQIEFVIGFSAEMREYITMRVDTKLLYEGGRRG